MGYNTPLLIYNDMLSALKEPEIGTSIDRAIMEAFRTRKQAYISSRSGSLGIALPSEHADLTRTLVMGGNTAVEVGGVWNGGHLPYTEDRIEGYLKGLVESYGYKLTRS